MRVPISVLPETRKKLWKLKGEDQAKASKRLTWDDFLLARCRR